MRSAASFVEGVVAVIYTLLYFLEVRLLMAAFALPALLMRLLRLPLLLGRAPLTGALLLSALLVALGQPLLREPLVAGLSAWGYWAACWLALAAFAIAGFAAERIPPSLDAIDSSLLARWPWRWLARQLEHDVDAVFARIALSNTILVAPPVLSMLITRELAPVTLLHFITASIVTGFGHEVLDHTRIHNDVFGTREDASPLARAVIGALAFYVGYLLNPMCGRIPNWYQVQHVTVHHAEDNGPDDTQTTLVYDRLSFFDFCRAALRFAVSLCFAPDVIAYLWRRKRSKALRKLVLRGLLPYYAAMGVLVWWYWPLPALLFASRFIGGVPGTLNFFQWHALVNMERTDDTFASSINFLTPGEGHAALGNALHIEHHRHPAARWDSLVEHARSNKARYAASRSLGFRLGPGYMAGMTFVKALWTRRFELLAPHCVTLADERPLDPDALPRLIEERTRPRRGGRRRGFFARLDHLVGATVARVLV